MSDKTQTTKFCDCDSGASHPADDRWKKLYRDNAVNCHATAEAHKLCGNLDEFMFWETRAKQFEDALKDGRP